MIWKVRWDKKIEKMLDDLPKHVVGSFYDWTKALERDGMEATRKLPGYHDEKLNGKLSGLRSVRLGKAYRVFYFEMAEGTIKIAQVEKVSKHEYKK
ncbi:MAG: hypothetical protein LC102_01135 [Ignavibacteriales bacterium]|nr:hypothetical protein [Ignavibacteriales bacterium]